MTPERLQQIKNIAGNISLEADSKPGLHDELLAYIAILEKRVTDAEYLARLAGYEF